MTAFEDAYGETPNQFAADAYDGIYILKEAMEKAEVTADMSASDISDALKAVMTEITFSGVTAKEMTWTADGEPEKAPMVLQIENGKYKRTVIYRLYARHAGAALENMYRHSRKRASRTYFLRTCNG